MMMSHISLPAILMILMTTQGTTLLERINTDRALHRVEDYFLSVTLDSYLMRQDVRWDTFDFRSEKVVTLLAGLSPAVVRVGGTPADFLLFDVAYDTLNRTHLDPDIVVMTISDWDNLVTLTRKTGNHLLFDLDLQLRYGRKWDPTNAVRLLDYSAAQAYGENIHFELGNEPGLFDILPGGSFQTRLSGVQIGQDMLLLHRLIRSYPNLSCSQLLGPDVMIGGLILREFVNVAGSVITAATLHHYYFSGINATYKDYTDPGHLAEFPAVVDLTKVILRDSLYPDTRLWLGETSDARNSGTAGVSDRYVSGFLWLEKLGMAARMDIGVVMRQTFYGHHYGLLNKQLEPNPDYWLSWLHKTLVGKEVLDVTMDADITALRVYSHCASHRSKYKHGSVTLLVVNLNQTQQRLHLEMPLQNQIKHLYLLEPGDAGNLLSEKVRLNGNILSMVTSSSLPGVKPRVIKPSEAVIFPSLTFGFVVLPEAEAAACMESS